MFSESTFEQHAANLLRRAGDGQDALFDPLLATVRTIQTVGASDLSLEEDRAGNTVIAFTQQTPAVVLGCLAELTEVGQTSARADSSMVAIPFRVFLLVSGFRGRNEAAEVGRPMLAALRNLYRGLRYTADDGATEGVARVFFRRQYLVADVAGVALYAQEYEIHTFDMNTTPRAL